MSTQRNLSAALFGYNRSRVQARMAEWEEICEEKQKRVLDLRDENEALKEEVGRLRAREKEVSQALIEAHARADDIIREAQAKAEEELRKSHQLLRQLEAMAGNRRSALEELARQAQGYAREFAEMLDEQDHTLELLENPVPELDKLMGRKSA